METENMEEISAHKNTTMILYNVQYTFVKARLSISDQTS